MKFFRFLLLFSVLSVVFINSYAQELRENEIVVINGEKFVLHQVRTGETIYSLSKHFKIERSQLLKYNPKISEGLDIGEILKIPYRTGANISQVQGAQKGDPTRFEIYKVKSRRETPYFIATKFGITVEELFAYNPKVRKFKRKREVRIPIWEKVKEKTIIGQEKENAVPDARTDAMIVHGVVAGETLYSIAKKYRVSESEIIFLNPEAKNLKAGANLNIPKKAGVVEVVADSVKTQTHGKYFEHIIESGETLWGTIRKYKVSENELLELNPALKNSFQAGMVIKIPIKDEVNAMQAKPINEKAFKRHFVEPGETLYGLAAKYSLTVPEIKKYNPILKTRNLVAGETILIPQKITDELVMFEGKTPEDSIWQIEAFFAIEEPTIVIPEQCRKKQSSPFQNEIFDVALFLPLYLEANDTLNSETIVVDSLSKNESKGLFKQFYRNTESFIEFYEGVLIAVDSMQNRGMNIRLHVFDTQRSIDSIREFIYTLDFLETDLIIGPIYERVQKEVAEIAAKNRIPIVSPLASQSMITKSNPEFYQAVPSRDYIAEKTAEMVAEEYFNSNFIVLKTEAYEGTPEGRLVELIQEKLYNSGFLSNPTGVSFTVYDFKNEGPYGLMRIMSHEKENVIYIPSSKEGELSVAVSNLNNLASDYSITLIGSNRYKNYHSIDVEQFHNLKLKYIAPYWIDYESSTVNEFLKKYRNNFATEPGRIGVQGFDVSFYFLNALYYFGKDFGECLPYLQVNLVQGNYHFEKVSQFGGFMNQGVSVVSYTPDYEVHRTRVKGVPVQAAK